MIRRGFWIFPVLLLFWSGTASAAAQGSTITLPAVQLEEKVIFEDIRDHWCRSYVEALAVQQVVQGKAEGVFDPDGGLTRAELVALAVRVSGKTAQGALFADVAADAWFASAVATASGLGFIPKAMVADGNFYPDRKITREEMTAVLTAVYEQTGRQAVPAALDGFSDRAAITDDYVASVGKAVGLGLVNGNANGTFAPQDGATRAEAATILFRLQKRI